MKNQHAECTDVPASASSKTMRRRAAYALCSGLLAVGIASSLVWSPAARAADRFAQGPVEFVRTHDAIAYPQWVPPLFWFSLKNVVNVGACSTYQGRVVFVARDKEAYQLVLSAQTSGHEIAVHLDDTVTVNGWCVVKYVTIGNPVTIP